MKFFARFAALWCLIVTASSAAFSQAAPTFPSKPVRLVVPFAPGGVADTMARLVAAQLGPRLGEPIVVENRTGAGGTLAATYVARADPDGYVLLLVAAGHAGSKALYPSVPYDPVASFDAVSGIAAYPVVLLVRPDAPYRNVEGLIEDIRLKAGKLNNANPGPSTVPGLSAALFRQRFGLDFASIPYRGSNPALIALMGGETEFSFNETGSSVELIRAGKVRALAVLQKDRLAALPQVPSIDESPMSGFYASAWLGVLAPRGTPATVVNRLNREIGQILGSQELQERLRIMGGVALGGSPQKFAAMLAEETERWSSAITRLGLKAE